VKGTWQGSGTWQTTSGPNLGPVIAIIAAIVILDAVAAVVAEIVHLVAEFVPIAAVLTILGVAGLLRMRRAANNPEGEAKIARQGDALRAEIAAEKARRPAITTGQPLTVIHVNDGGTLNMIAGPGQAPPARVVPGVAVEVKGSHGGSE
jgi:hypothetical protein